MSFPLHKNTKKSDIPLFGQLLELIPQYILTASIDKYQTDKYYSSYKTYDHLAALMFGQQNKCTSHREICIGMGGDEKFLRDIKLGQSPARSTMSDGNEKRNYKVFSDRRGVDGFRYPRTRLLWTTGDILISPCSGNASTTRTFLSRA